MNKIVIALCAITAATAITAAVTSDEIAQYMAKFKSSDSNAQFDAISFFEYIAVQKGLALPEDLNRTDVEAYLKRWTGNSYKAALLLGLLGDKDSAPVLNEIKAEAKEIERKADPMDDRNTLAPKIRLACLKALLRLEDDEAIKELRLLLESSRVDDRTKGIECVSYARSKEFISDLIPLLDDKHDAVNIAPSGGTYFLRICDLVVNTITDIAKVTTSFTVQHGERYSGEQIAEFRASVLLQARVTLKPEALEVSPGILTAFVRLPEGYPVSGIASATCDGAQPERMMPNEDGTEMIIKFRRKDIETALGQIGQAIDASFIVRGTWQGAAGTRLFQGTDSIKKIVEDKGKETEKKK